MGAVLDEYLWELSGLNRRLREVAQGLTSEQLDRAPAKDANSIAVLVRHAIGSELAWLHLAAGRAHERDRDSEFATKRLEAADLARTVDDAERIAPGLVRAAFAAGLETVRERPGARPVTVGYCLTHAATHLAEHIGHAEVARQVLTGASGSV
jgi:uncharacterized damage-inducible protein DinB